MDSKPNEQHKHQPYIDQQEKPLASFDHNEHVDSQGNLVYENTDEEPELHLRTWVALASMFLLNLVQVFALQGPPAVLSYIGEDLNGTVYQTWVPNALSLVQAVVGPVISSASDAFQARKIILVVSCIISFIGCAIAPGSQSIYRLIAAQTLIGVGFASVPIAYSVPSEITPRKWRPMAQAGLNIAAAFGAISSPLVIGAFTRNDPMNGWKKFYWVQFALWGATALGILFGYRPPKRHTRFDNMSLWQKIGQLDLIGFALLTSGLALFLTGLNQGGGIYPWKDGRVLGTLVTGLVILVGFALFEWKGTKTGILNHELFRGGKEQGRTYALCLVLIFIEGILLFSYIIFYPELTGALFETDPLLLVVRSQPWWIGALLSTAVYGYTSTKFRSIRGPLGVGFVLLTAGVAGLATIQPGQSANSIGFAALAGIGFGAPLVLIIAGVHLSVPHHLIATATAVTASSRAVAASVFTAIYAAAVSDKTAQLVPGKVAPAVLGAGLPPQSLPAFLGALAARDDSALMAIPGVNPGVIGAGVAALQQALADSFRVVYIIAAAFGALGCVACLFMGNLSKSMNYMVEAPVENLRSKGFTQKDVGKV